MRDRFLCLSIGLLLGLMPSALGCCSQDVRAASAHVRDGAADMKAASGRMHKAWLAFRASSGPADDLDPRDAGEWQGVAAEMDAALGAMATAAADLEEAAAAVSEYAGAPEGER